MTHTWEKEKNKKGVALKKPKSDKLQINWKHQESLSFQTEDHFLHFTFCLCCSSSFFEYNLASFQFLIFCLFFFWVFTRVQMTQQSLLQSVAQYCNIVNTALHTKWLQVKVTSLLTNDVTKVFQLNFGLFYWHFSIIVTDKNRCEHRHLPADVSVSLFQQENKYFVMFRNVGL